MLCLRFPSMAKDLTRKESQCDGCKLFPITKLIFYLFFRQIKRRFDQSLNSTCKLFSAQEPPNTAITCIKMRTHSQSLEKTLTHHRALTWTISVRGTTMLRCFVDTQTCSCRPHFGRHLLVLLFQVSFLHCPLAA